MDILCYHLKVDPAAGATGVKATMSIPATKPKLKRRVAYDPNTRLLTVETRFPRVDGRDPDPDHPLTICVIVPEAFNLSGALPEETEEAVQVTLTAKAEAVAKEQTFVVGIGEGETAAGIKARTLRLAGIGSRESRAASKRWLAKSLDKFTFEGVPANMRLHYAKSAYQLLSNTK
ncbi:MAG: hypothetical protein Q7T82_18430, partial [Armatimonadota bacterium]|nr:hypothetical protein [Armatimonadota bacterium]